MKSVQIDIHTHILPRQLPDLRDKYGYGGWISLHPLPDVCLETSTSMRIKLKGKVRMMLDGKFFRDVEENCWMPETRIKDCMNTGVDAQVISTVPVLFNYWAKPEHTLDLARCGLHLKLVNSVIIC
jgi:aminocarboxymuconate-semialdehyde decarboxylase